MNSSVYIVGPTAVGKSSWSLALAEKHGYEIMNSDSMQFYRDLKVGTASPTQEDFKKVPHHLYSFLDYSETLTAGGYRELALKTGSSLKSPTLIVGGSGFYIRALDQGMFDLPQIEASLEDQLKSELTKFSPEALFEKLKSVDPAWAIKLHVNDRYRVERALVVHQALGKKLSEFQESSNISPPSPKVGLFLDRAQLRKRVKKRLSDQFIKALLEEVEQVLEKQNLKNNINDENFLEKVWKPLKSIGYKEALQFLRGEISSLEDLNFAIETSTMRYAKRQMTWFKKDISVQWFNAETHLVEAQEATLKILN